LRAELDKARKGYLLDWLNGLSYFTNSLKSNYGILILAYF
jgi:hypothetical protein